MLGLEAVGKLNIQGLRNEVLPLVDEASPPEMIRLVISALKNQPVENKETFIKLAGMETLDIEQRASSIQTVAIVDLKAANNILAIWVPKLDLEQKKKSHQPNGQF
ncbi:hypothetical protein [Algoriphagus boritolerans]|uniref:hypothetical protein n=1 Tax=Algoriphagus boritolerans TaxID=308111 RepID=UPI000A3DC34D